MSWLPRPISGRGRVVVPTGPALLQLVRTQGDLMLQALRSGDQTRYRAERQRYIELLEIAEHDSYCAPILTASVQSVLDEESRAWRDRKS